MTPWPPLTWLEVLAYLSVGIAVLVLNAMLIDISVRGHIRRSPSYAAVAVLGCESIACFFAASDEWTEQWTEGNFVGINSVHGRFAVELCAVGALCLLLLSILLLLRRSGWVWWLAIGIQLVVFLSGETEALLIDPNSPGWSGFSYIPLVASSLLFVIYLAGRRLKPAANRTVTP